MTSEMIKAMDENDIDNPEKPNFLDFEKATRNSFRIQFLNGIFNNVTAETFRTMLNGAPFPSREALWHRASIRLTLSGNLTQSPSQPASRSRASLTKCQKHAVILIARNHQVFEDRQSKDRKLRSSK